MTDDELAADFPPGRRVRWHGNGVEKPRYGRVVRHQRMADFTREQFGDMACPASLADRIGVVVEFDLPGLGPRPVVIPPEQLESAEGRP